MAQERLQKILARAGVASRRAAEGLIEAGRVKIDGKVVTELGTKADAERQKITLDGKLLAAEPLVYVVFHKPRSVVCTMSDPEGRETVAEYVKQVAAHVVPVGRLDYHTSGVLLLTNDGDFAAKLLHPSSHAEKIYVAKVRGTVRDSELDEWRQSIQIDGRDTVPADVRRLRFEGDKTWLEIILREGKNRQIHRVTEAAGSEVFRLARVSFAGVSSDGLRPGQWRYLSRDELTGLKKTFGVPVRIQPAPPLPNAEAIKKLRAGGVGRGERGVVDGKPRRRFGLSESRAERERLNDDQGFEEARSTRQRPTYGDRSTQSGEATGRGGSRGGATSRGAGRGGSTGYTGSTERAGSGRGASGRGGTGRAGSTGYDGTTERTGSTGRGGSTGRSGTGRGGSTGRSGTGRSGSTGRSGTGRGASTGGAFVEGEGGTGSTRRGGSNSGTTGRAGSTGRSGSTGRAGSTGRSGSTERAGATRAAGRTGAGTQASGEQPRQARGRSRADGEQGYSSKTAASARGGSRSKKSGAVDTSSTAASAERPRARARRKTTRG